MRIKLKNVTIKIKSQSILEDVNMLIGAKECIGLIGHNGSGKSVLLKAICGFIPFSGRINAMGKDVIAGKQFIIDSGIMIEQPDMIGYLTALENLQLLADLIKEVSTKQLEEVLVQVGLVDCKGKKVKHFSLGMKQRLRIAQALMEDPAILILDEPFNGLDKRGVAEIAELLQELKKQGKTILLTSHDERQIDALCDRVYEIEGGRLFCVS
ncbi:MAG TPA: multidrug ABC transporter ATP-binding protein [Enterococcus sp.]|nr:multidrug ABC transporter ATP-binding protein [Enterococcus sp.]